MSAYGSAFGFGAMSLIAIRSLGAGPGEVSLLASVGLLSGAALAVGVGPRIEVRRKRPVMVATDLVRFAAQLTVPIAFVLGLLTFWQLLVVVAVVAAAKIAFQAASGAHLKALVAPDELLVANGRFESTTWSALVIGPPLGGAAVGAVGVVAGVTVDAVSYLLSALAISMIATDEPRPPRRGGSRPGVRDVPDSWRYIVGHPGLRGPFFNHVLVAGLILAPEPALSVLMLRDLGFAPWQYGLAFAAPCVGGLVGARLSPRLVARLGRARVMSIFGTLRIGWPIGLAFIPAGTAGLAMVVGLQFGLIVSVGIFSPVLATHRLEQTAPDRLARTLSAWAVTSSATIAVMTAAWGVLAGAIGLRAAIAAAGLLALPTPLLLPRGRAARSASRAAPATGPAGPDSILPGAGTTGGDSASG